MDIVFSILIVLAIVVIFCKIRASNDNESITTREIAKSAYSYSKEYDTGSKGVLLVKMKSEAAVKALEFSEGHDLIVNNTPDKLVYTGATVGGVTTGGFHVQKGSTSVTQGDATGRWFVHYRFASEFNGQPWSDIVVYMQLTDQLFAEAKDNVILKD